MFEAKRGQGRGDRLPDSDVVWLGVSAPNSYYKDFSLPSSLSSLIIFHQVIWT